MILDEFIQLNQQQAKCPTSFSPALQALWYDYREDWHNAHEIVQNASDADSAWVHAYLHRKEGDLSNARYWYRRSDRPEFQGSLKQEWKKIVKTLLAKN